MDDFQTPYGGIPEVSALLFGDSWKLQPHCTPPFEIRVSVIPYTLKCLNCNITRFYMMQPIRIILKL